MEELSWATQGPLWPVCCGRATLGYSGTTLVSVLCHFGQCAMEELSCATQGPCVVEELSWATGRAEVQSSKNLTTPQSYGWEKSEHPRASCEVLCQQLRPRQRQQPPPTKNKRLDKYITTLQLSWDHFGKCAVEELRCATQGLLW